MLTSYKFNALFIEKLKKKPLLGTLDEMRFDIKHTGKKSFRDESLVEQISSPAIRGVSLKTSKPKRACTRFFFNPIEL